MEAVLGGSSHRPTSVFSSSVASDLCQIMLTTEILTTHHITFLFRYRPRPGENVTANTITCPNISAVTKQHAEWLTEAGYDYVAVDITNWPVTGWIGSSTSIPNNDITIMRPLEVLAEEWLALRAAGIKTPSIAAWTNVECKFDAHLAYGRVW